MILIFPEHYKQVFKDFKVVTIELNAEKFSISSYRIMKDPKNENFIEFSASSGIYTFTKLNMKKRENILLSMANMKAYIT